MFVRICPCYRLGDFLGLPYFWQIKNKHIMKLRFFLSLFVALFIGGSSVYADSLKWGDIILEGEFSNDESRSIGITPISACISDNTVYIEFSKGVTDVTVTVKNSNNQEVYSTSMIATATEHTATISVADYAPGTYYLEFTNSKGGYVYGLFIIE